MRRTLADALADEPALLARAITLVQAITDVPLSIDSSIIDALERGLSVYKGKALVNSVTGEDESLERVRAMNEIAARRGQSLAQLAHLVGQDIAGPGRDRKVHSRLLRRLCGDALAATALDARAQQPQPLP